MISWQTPKNILAVIGGFIVAIIVLTVVVMIFSGSGKIGVGDKIVVVKLEGVITDPIELQQELKELEERRDVKAVILRIDSPGGAVGPSQEIYSAVKRLKKVKPVVASMGSVAASGGLYAAMGASKVVANPGTITGSIGVIIQFMNVEETFNKLGLKGSVIKSGKFKDTGSPLRPMTDEDKALLQAVIDDVNKQFIKAVADGRSLKVEDVEKFADGRILSGSQAKLVGLVDILGDLSDSIDIAAKLANIEGKPNVVYPEKKRLGLLGAIFGETVINKFADSFSGARIMYLLPVSVN